MRNSEVKPFEDGIESQYGESKTLKEIPHGLYIRVSTDRQVHDRQMHGINLKMQGLPRNASLEATYQEKASARANKKRPKFDQMMADLKSRKIRVIIAYSMDRFVRSSKDFHNAVSNIKNWGGELHLIKENLTINNENTPYQNLMGTIFAAMAEFESELISERTRESMETTRVFNPFVRYGQPPKIKGRQVAVLLKMYYKQEKRPRKWDTKRLGPKFAFTLDQIANKFGITKGGLSQWIDARVTSGHMKLRQPNKVYELTKDEVAGLDYPKAQTERKLMVKNARKEEMTRRVLAPIMWPKAIREQVSKKFGKGYDQKGAGKKAVKAFQFGTRLYSDWLKEMADDGKVDGLFDDIDAMKIIKEYTEVLEAPSVKALSDSEKPNNRA